MGAFDKIQSGLPGMDGLFLIVNETDGTDMKTVCSVL